MIIEFSVFKAWFLYAMDFLLFFKWQRISLLHLKFYE